MGRDRKRVRKPTPTEGVGGSNQAGGGVLTTCSLCESVIGRNSELKCKACGCSYHNICANISDDVFDVLQPILPAVGWVCQDCVDVASSKRKAFDVEIQSINVAVRKLEQGYNSLIQRMDKADNSINRSVAAANSSQPTTASHITQVVNNAVKDQLRRKKNVIISGLPESNDMSDADAVRSLCEEYIGCKPWFDDTRCKRIGQAGGNPRRLLVTLATDQAAAELLYSAKRNLRKADPSSLASKVYFNPDLSPEEAKQAYLKRQERRQRRNNQQSTGDNALLNPLAPSFQTEAC